MAQSLDHAGAATWRPQPLDWAAAAWRHLSSVTTFLWLAGLLLALCVAGSLVPQGLDPELLAGRLGPFWSGLARHTGVSNLFRAPWFHGLLAAIGLNVAACSVRRIRSIGARPGVFLCHLSVLLILGGALARLMAGESGILQLEAGYGSEAFQAGPGLYRPLPFQVRLDSFQVEYWRPPSHNIRLVLPLFGMDEVRTVRVGETLRLGDAQAALQVLAYYPNFYLSDKGPATRDQNPRNPALELAYSRGGGAGRKFWAFARFPDPHQGFEDGRVLYQYDPGTIRQFKSEVTILERGREALRRAIRVNHPLSYKGHTLYQYGYEPGDSGRATLLVKRDPGIPAVYLGFGLLAIGLAWNLVGRGGAFSLS